MEQQEDIKELAFARELEKYVNKWVAITHYGSEDETVVATGNSLREARLHAESDGYKEVTFFKVPPVDKLFVALMPVQKRT
jgi:hypothetical protein